MLFSTLVMETGLKAKAQKAEAKEQAAIEPRKQKLKLRFVLAWRKQNWKLNSNYSNCLNVARLCQVNQLLKVFVQYKIRIKIPRLALSLIFPSPRIVLVGSFMTVELQYWMCVLRPFSFKNWEYKKTKLHLTFEQDRTKTKERPF